MDNELVEAVAPEQHIAEGLNAIFESMIEVICLTGKVPVSKYDIPAGVSLRLARKLRQIGAALTKQGG